MGYELRTKCQLANVMSQPTKPVYNEILVMVRLCGKRSHLADALKRRRWVFVAAQVGQRPRDVSEEVWLQTDTQTTQIT